MLGNGFQSVTGQFAGHEVMPPHGVERVDQLASARAPTPLRGFAPQRVTDTPQHQAHPQRPPASLEERQIEAAEVVVLQDVRVAGLHDAHEVAQHLRFITLEQRFKAARVAHRDHEDAPARIGIQARRLEVKLQARQIRVLETVKVSSPSLHQVLLRQPDGVILR